MRFSAISYRLRPGAEDEAAALLAAGDEAATGGPVLAAAAYLQHGSLVQVWQHEGDPAKAIESLTARPGLVAEQTRLAALAVEPQQLDGPGAVGAFLRAHEMRSLQQRVVHPAPAVRMFAHRHLVKPGSGYDIAKVFTGVRPAPRPAAPAASGPALVLAVALFLRDEELIRIVQHTGTEHDVAEFMLTWPARQMLEQQLAPFFTTDRQVATREEFLAQFAGDTMRQVRSVVSPAPAER